MKIICAISSRNDEILRIRYCLETMGHEVRMFYMDSFYTNCSYLEKKMNKLGISNSQKGYNQAKQEEINRMYAEFQPEQILFVDFEAKFFSVDMLAEWRKKSRIVFWFVDELAGHPEVEMYLSSYDVFVYEKSDVQYLQEKYNLHAQYCPVGYNDAYENVNISMEKNIDITFIGSPFKRRLLLLELLAVATKKYHWTMKVYGPFCESKYFWKSYLFRRKYPLLAECVENGSIIPEDAARVYASSKICLNIHGSANRSLNPRTFEIMATGSFELMDAHADYAGLVQPGKHLACFSDADELVSQVQYYLEHDTERELLASQGQKRVRNRYSMIHSLGQLLSGNHCYQEEL